MSRVPRGVWLSLLAYPDQVKACQLPAHGGSRREAALRAIELFHLDAKVMDIMMPKMNGFEVLARMRADGMIVPTILLTAKDISQDIVHGLDLGADDYLTKVFDLAVLLAPLRALIRRPVILTQGPLPVGKLVLRHDTHR